MIQLSPRGQALYQLLSLTVLLLLLYGIGFTLSALYELPDNPLATVIDQDALRQFTEQMFKLTILTGFVTAGLMMSGDGMSSDNVSRSKRIFSALVLFTVISSPFVDKLLLDTAAALALLLLLALSRSAREDSAFLRNWQLGIALIVVSLPAAHLVDGAMADALRAFQIHVAYSICGIAILFWLMRRYSHVESEWARDGVKIVAVLVFLAGSLISLGNLGLPPVISLGATILIPLCYMLLASHSYRALSTGNENASLATHYISLATMLWLVGGGFLGTISVQPAVSEAMRGTDLAAAQHWLAQWVMLAIALAFVNEAATSLRGDNRRVTGFVSLWLMAFGAGLAGITQACRGVAQIYLRDFALEQSAMTDLLLPLTFVWIVCALATAGGIATYALGFWLRRPEIRVVES